MVLSCGETGIGAPLAEVVLPENAEGLTHVIVVGLGGLQLLSDGGILLFPSFEIATCTVDGAEVANIAVADKCLESCQIVKKPTPAHDMF